MTHATLLSAGFQGIDAVPVEVELDISEGMLPRWSTVGLAESAVRESKDRVISAVHNCGYSFKFRRITLNLAPANLKKSGTAYDLPIAIGLLSAAEFIPPEGLNRVLMLGELSLTGLVRPVRGVLSVAILAKKMGIPKIIIPWENMREAAAVDGLQILGATSLPEVVEHLAGRGGLPGLNQLSPLPASPLPALPDISEVVGQDQGKRALEIAACGFHNLLFTGPPGTGKSMLASRLPALMPPLSQAEALSTSQIYSTVGLLTPGQGLLEQRPFRNPHHSISDAGLIGGGSQIRPGEVSLAHNGVLFLDELTEFRRNVLEAMRQPLENQQVTIARAKECLTFPARFLLAAAMNPCPCGQQGNPNRICQCDELSLKRYQNKISGPLLDRIDLQVKVPPIAYAQIQQGAKGPTSKQLLQKIMAAQDRQHQRLAPDGLRFNSQMNSIMVRRYCDLQKGSQKLMALAMNKWGWSARAHDRILKVARTIADLADSTSIEEEHLSEAMAFRLS